MELHYRPEQNPRQALGLAFKKGCASGSRKLTLAGGLGFDLSGIETED